MESKYYVYVYLDSRKPGNYKYDNLSFSYEPFYVGKGKGHRDREHLRLKCCSNIFKNSKIAKIFEAGLVPIIIRLADNLDNREALSLEILTISTIGRANKNAGSLTNLTDGGETTIGRICRTETKELMSFQRKGKKQTVAQYDANCSRGSLSEEHRRKISEAQRGVRRLSNDQYVKIANKNRGSKRSDLTRALMSEQRKGKKQTPAQYSANCARLEKFDWISYDDFKKYVSKLPATINKARLLIDHIKETNPPRVPKNPYTTYRKRGEWVSWNDLFR